MDKLGAIRFKQSSGHKLVSGFGVVLEKSKKERIRKLSAIGSSSFEMGCDVSDREDDELPSKRFKLPRKFLGECNGVHLGSVPRKLRTAMKKRHRQSFPHSRKLVSGIESLSCDGVKRPCLKQGNRSLKETVSGPITKDEEEVVETLYALAGLVFPNNEANGISKRDSETFDADASDLPESKNSPKPAAEVGDIKMDPVFPCRAASSTSPSFEEGLAKGTDQVDLLNKPGIQYQPELPNGGKSCIDSDNNIPQNQINISSLSAKVEKCNEKPFGNAVNFCDPSELSLDIRLKQNVEWQTSVFGRKQENVVELATNTGSQVQKHDMLQESRKKGSGLWPGLSSNVSHARSDSPLPQSPAATLPPWMDTPCSTSKALVPNGSSFAKVTKVVNGRRLFKKCAAHVYISHLIQSLKSSDNKDKLMLHPSQMRSQEESRQGAFLLGVSTFTNVKSGFNEATSSSSISFSTAENVPNEPKNGILQHRNLHIDQPSSTLASGVHTSPKQTFDFLSLSAGGGSLENNDSFSRGRYGMELLSQAQLPYLHSSVQHQNLTPFSMTRSRYSSSASLCSHSVAQQGQLLPLYGNPYCGPQANATALTKQPIQHQQLHMQQQQQQHLHVQQQQQQHQHQQQQQLHLQQQQRHWAAQLATQYRPVGTLAATAPSPSWQNIKQENCTLTQCGQSLLSPSPSTLELVGPKYATLSLHQQQQMAVTSFPSGRVKLPDHRLPSAYEESVGRYRAASALPLQLLCDERL